ncbi:MAG: hypothetical protein KAW00_04625 [Dehalococcoidia bacterium]|nr:hypothetical protein [Dehalococcoidia bacterium]
MWKVYFNLNKPSPLGKYSEINGMKVSISEGSKELIVENIDAGDNRDAQQKALSAGNSFLDALWKCHTYLDIDPTPRVAEHVRPTGTSISITPTPASSVASVGSPGVEIRDSSGNIIEVRDSSKPGRIEIKPKHSEAASHYRHAHFTNDTFNRFHDLYLAAENIASKIQEVKGLSKSKVRQLSESGSCGEGLLRLALDECFSSNLQSLNQVAKNLPEFDDSKDTIPQVAKMLYGYRCQVDHSKALRDKKLPFDSQDEREVKAALPLMEFVARSLLQYEENSLLK